MCNQIGPYGCGTSVASGSDTSGGVQLLILDADAKTSAAHGCKPSERSVEQLLQAGIIVIDKPAGPNSHQVSAWARDILEVEKLGHGGTLDPFATGVLLLLSGRSMRLTKKVLAHNKTCLLYTSPSPRD